MTWLIDAHENDPDPIHKDPRFENSTYLTYSSLNYLLMVLKMVIRGLQVSNHRRQRHYFNNSDIYLLPPLS